MTSSSTKYTSEYVRRKHVSARARKILWPLPGSIGDLLNGVVELAQEACFCQLAALAVPRTIFFDLYGSIFEELEMH